MTAPAHPNAPPTPGSLDELLLLGLALEREAVSRYNELADMMQVHNNLEVAELFRKMARYEAHHVDRILAQLGREVPEGAVELAAAWRFMEAPETVPIEDMHYLMQPWHALKLALAAEKRAQAFFEAMAREAGSDEVRQAAEQMRNEEAEHVALVEAWLARVPRPENDWSVDPDPPRFFD